MEEDQMDELFAQIDNYDMTTSPMKKMDKPLVVLDV